jgi:regulatory protein
MDAQPAQSELERALDLAYHAVGRRERTIAELRTCLERKRVGPAAIDAAVERLREDGLLDDARYARRFADDKRELERWGRERIARDLHRRGVPPDLIEAAVADRGREAELATALLLLEQRFPTPPSDDRGRGRAWSLLIRRGYASELAYHAVRAHEQQSSSGSRAG